ncbi:MAG: outer membrane protein assembly factor BamB family protein [Planctomycetota bacterium]|jgi:outer membrane protein assembly factor BamB/tetratricopeptide (TPR) repeat protein
MSEAGELLDSAEVEFLLENASDQAEGQESPEESLETQEVTMSGDLDKIDLTDIIQTLAMSKMEGLMRIRNPLEHRQLFFHEGFVRVLAPNRVETKRLGQRLIRSGHLTVEQLRSALLLQKKTHQHLGEILIGEGWVNEADIEGLVVMQVEEDLLSIFTWKHGTFEFFKGPCTDLDLRRKLELTPEFDASGVLLEVARRKDEWELIMDTLGSLDEILVPGQQQADAKLDEEQRLVLEAIDGRRSVRDISDISLLQIFECGRAARLLVNAGLAECISIEKGLEISHDLLDQGNSKLAMVTLRALADRPGPWPKDVTLELAELLHRCGQHRWAGELVVEAAKAEPDEESALELARQARKISSRSIDILKFLYDRLSATDSATSAECADVVSDLVSGLVDEKEFDEALFLLEELEQLAPDNTNTLSRKAQVLCKLDRSDEAVQVLQRLAEFYKKDKRQDKLASVYEQILKIDFRRKDIAKALKVLHASQLTKKLRGVIYAAVVLIAAGASYWLFQEQQKAGLISELEGTVAQRMQVVTQQLREVDSLLAAGDAEAAMAGIQSAMASVHSVNQAVLEATEDYGEMDALARLRTSLDKKLSEAQKKRSDLMSSSQADMVELTREKLAAGNLSEALQLIDQLDDKMMSRDAMEREARSLIIPLIASLSDKLDTLPHRIPELPNLLQTHAEREEVLAELRTDFPETDLRLIHSFLELSEDERLRTIVGEAYFADAQEKSTALKEVFARAASVRESYLAEVMRTRTAQRLTPLFQAAKVYEQNYEFEKARAAYEKLARNHPDKDPLWRHFQNQVEKYATILRFLQVLEDATEKGDFKTARGQLRTLNRAFPNIPFETLSFLPIRIETQPPGAKVLINGQAVGKSPLLSSFQPGEQTRIRIELDRFYPEETIISGDDTGVVRSLLTRKADWVFQAGSSIERTPVMDEKNRVFVVDRGGVITALEMETGDMLWSLRTGDLSGLLPPPALAEDDCLILASIDGQLRCLERASGKIRWQADDIPTESRPLCSGQMVYVATNDGRLVSVDASTGQIRFNVDLDGPVRADLIQNGQKIIAVTTQGSVFCVDSLGGKLLWQAKSGQGVFCSPVIADGKLAVLSDEGRITVFNADNGKKAWEKQGLGTLILAPTAASGGLFVCDHKTLYKFDLESGKRLAQIKNPAVWSSHLGSGDGMIFAGDRSGLIQVFADKDLRPMFRVRSTKAALAPMVLGNSGRAVAAFEDRLVQGFLELK